MDKTTKEVIRQAVRERYGKIANAGSVVSGISPGVSCCGDSGAAASCCGGSDVTSEQMAALMGYSKQDLTSVPDGANMGLGCGNPVALAWAVAVVLTVFWQPNRSGRPDTSSGST